MADQHAGIDRGFWKAVEVVAKGGFAKRQPRRTGAEVVLHQLALAGEDGCHREPAMPDDLGRHPLAHLALGLGVDRQGEIRMGLDVDKAGRHCQAFGIDYLGRAPREGAADRRDPAVADRYVADLAKPATAVDYETAADRNVPIHQASRAERPRASARKS